VGTVHVTRAFLRIAEEGDALVNVASIAGHWSPKFLLPKRAFRSALANPARFANKIVTASNVMPRKARPGAAYGTSKAFVIWYSEQMAAAFGAKGARIVSVSPGTFDTEMGRLEVASGSDRLLDYAALNRAGKPEEIAAVLAFAASREPGYLTGVDILVDGGTNAGMKPSDFLAIARGQVALPRSPRRAYAGGHDTCSFRRSVDGPSVAHPVAHAAADRAVPPRARLDPRAAPVDDRAPRAPVGRAAVRRGGGARSRSGQIRRRLRLRPGS